MQLKSIGSVLLCLCLLTGCASRLPADPTDGGVPAEALHALGLTAEQRMEDYEYFWAVLRDSYPCWGILERAGTDVSAIYQEYKAMISEHDSDPDFYSAIYSALWRLGGTGHLWIVEPSAYRAMRAAGGLCDQPGRTHWAELLEDPATAAGYERLEAMLAMLEDETEAGSAAADAAPNVTTLLLPEMKTAYLKVSSFSGDLEEDGRLLDAFYEELAGYGALIIDIRENSGGSERYWQELLVAPHIDQPLRCSNYALTRMSANNRPFLEEAFAPEELHPIAELPDLPALQASDRALATHYVESVLSVSPAARRSPFRGRIWVLVGSQVYSASESFAVFCRETGFASLAGAKTGGDGIGATDPVFLQLPNSGILIQFTALFGLNPDGSSNEETGTAPDLPSPAGEPPLVTALRAIASQKGS